MATNNWIMMNSRVLKQIKDEIFKYHLKGSYGGNLPLTQIINLFNGAENEIRILQAENERLALVSDKAKNELEELKTKISGVEGESTI